MMTTEKICGFVAHVSSVSTSYTPRAELPYSGVIIETMTIKGVNGIIRDLVLLETGLRRWVKLYTRQLTWE